MPGVIVVIDNKCKAYTQKGEWFYVLTIFSVDNFDWFPLYFVFMYKHG